MNFDSRDLQTQIAMKSDIDLESILGYLGRMHPLCLLSQECQGRENSPEEEGKFRGKLLEDLSHPYVVRGSEEDGYALLN